MNEQLRALVSKIQIWEALQEVGELITGEALTTVDLLEQFVSGLYLGLHECAQSGDYRIAHHLHFVEGSSHSQVPSHPASVTHSVQATEEHFSFRRDLGRLLLLEEFQVLVRVAVFFNLLDLFHQLVQSKFRLLYFAVTSIGLQLELLRREWAFTSFHKLLRFRRRLVECLRGFLRHLHQLLQVSLLLLQIPFPSQSLLLLHAFLLDGHCVLLVGSDFRSCNGDH
mmetsp:Transcript_16959/g.46006  ORF Transcript_16959/g.46006 Transcript_16959/m.46006 type:complete len:225 (-) Transcript_16959:1097-1771(-)